MNGIVIFKLYSCWKESGKGKVSYDWKVRDGTVLPITQTIPQTPPNPPNPATITTTNRYTPANTKHNTPNIPSRL